MRRTAVEGVAGTRAAYDVALTAIPASSGNRQLAIDWIRTFTSTPSMRTLTSSAGVIPNTTSLAGVNAGKPALAPFAQAAKSSSVNCRFFGFSAMSSWVAVPGSVPGFSVIRPAFCSSQRPCASLAGSE